MSQSALSLLSLSIAAASAPPIPASPAVESAARASQGPSTNTPKHRRLSSAGRSRRRLSDARDAATRPFPTSLQTASASFAALSLSSPTVSQHPVGGAQPIKVPQTRASTRGAPEPESASAGDSPSPLHSVTKQGRKRGTIFTCESCSKVYRHPSCLIKHRWEHTPQWQEASKFVLSKHQQVQLLEAAAILSHLSPSSASLPDDRSLWPSFLSGGLVPPPPSTQPQTTFQSASGDHATFPISSSVPATSLLTSHLVDSTATRLHDVSETSAAQFHPGLSSVPNAPADTQYGSSPLSVQALAMTTTTTEDDALNLLALRSEMSVTSHSHTRSHSHSLSYTRSHLHTHSHSSSLSDAPSMERERRWSNAGHDYNKFGTSGYAYTPNSNGGRSLPRSSVRSKSGSSRSRSVSQSISEDRSDDEDEVEFAADLANGIGDGTRGYASRMRLWKAEDADEGEVTRINLHEDAQDGTEDNGARRAAEQTWDGMEMEMEMD